MEILGHRGARGEAPENTLSGFQHLRNLGIRAVEFDIQVAGDGSLVALHDRFVDRTTNGTGPLKHYTAQELSRLDACHQRQYTVNGVDDQPWPVTEGVPRLEQVLDILHDFRHIQLEVKSRHPDEVDQVIRAIRPFWERFGNRAIVTAFNTRFLELMRLHHPDIPLGLLVEEDFREDAVALAHTLGCVSLGPHVSLCTPALVQQAHAAHIKVSVWTVNEPADMLALRDMGADSLITDVPTQAMGVLDSRPPLTDLRV